jgi:hypothetical protein
MSNRIRLGNGAPFSSCSKTRATSTVYSSNSSATIATCIILIPFSDSQLLPIGSLFEKQQSSEDLIEALKRGGLDNGVLSRWDWGDRF